MQIIDKLIFNIFMKKVENSIKLLYNFIEFLIFIKLGILKKLRFLKGMITNMRHLIEINDLTVEEIDNLIKVAKDIMQFPDKY